MLMLRAEGLTNEAAGRQLRIALPTAKKYLQRLFARWNVQTAEQAVTFAYRNGYITIARITTPLNSLKDTV